jgi:hypothetical protein
MGWAALPLVRRADATDVPINARPMPAADVKIAIQILVDAITPIQKIAKLAMKATALSLTIATVSHAAMALAGIRCARDVLSMALWILKSPVLVLVITTTSPRLLYAP